jgi:hypothetical protein
VRKSFSIQGHEISILSTRLKIKSVIFYMIGIGYQSRSSQTAEQIVWDHYKQEQEQLQESKQETETYNKLFIAKEKGSK